MNLANKCPKCSQYIIGEHCFHCNIDIRDYISNDMPEFFKDIFGDFKGDKNGK